MVPTTVSPTNTLRLEVVPRFTPRTLTMSRLLPRSRYRAVPLGVVPLIALPVNAAASGPFGHCSAAPATSMSAVNGIATHPNTRERQSATEPKLLLIRLLFILDPLTRSELVQKQGTVRCGQTRALFKQKRPDITVWPITLF